MVIIPITQFQPVGLTQKVAQVMGAGQAWDDQPPLPHCPIIIFMLKYRFVHMEGGKSVLSQDGGLAKFMHCMRLPEREINVTPLQKAAPVYE